MRRLLPLILVLAGCGGHGGGSVSLPQYDALGAASVDLAFSGGVSATDAPAPLVGTGAARGRVTVVAPPGDGNAVEATALVQGAIENGLRTDRSVAIVLGAPALAAGATYALDGRTNSVEYVETDVQAKGEHAGEAVSRGYGKSTGGTVTVVSLVGGVATLRLTDVAYPIHEGTSAVVLSGTVSGRVVAAVDQG